MKYDVYISDAKVNMLFPQVPHDIKRKVSTKFGFDFKVVSASRQTEAETDENRISRLETVVEFIREFGNLGTVEQPDEYIEGDLVLHTAVFPDRNPKYVYFGGSRERSEPGPSQIGLWGSLRHVVGAADFQGEGVTSTSLARDAIWHLIKDLDPEFEPRSAQEADWIALMDKRARDWTALRVNSFQPEFREAWWGLVMAATHEAKFATPGQRMEFLAKRLLHQDRFALLATPLYVALTD